MAYVELKALHISCAVISICGFIARGWGAWHNADWIHRRWVRVAPHVIDTVLLASGAAMALQLGAAAWRSNWLVAKLIALAAYIALGSVALRKGRPMTTGRCAFIGALASVAWIAGAALTKSAWGPLAWIRAF